MAREVEATAKLALCSQCGEAHGEDMLRCPATDMMLPLEGRRLDGKFRFLSSLGAGGMASVYLAVNERVDREVAIKFLRPEVGRDPESVARFRSEAKAAGRIGNRHICEILDLGDSPIGPYIVMERLRGIDLAALIRRQGLLAPGYAVRVVRHALEGLAAAHAAGIVHRDLKPGNIFLHRSETGDTIVKLMDFGVSKFLDGTNEAQTASGILLGTPEYMAPEQLEGANKIGLAADIWAMGAILYRAITGHQVFSGPSLAAVIKSMALDEVTPLSRLVEGVPAELEAVIHRCLERDPSKRYHSAAELSDALAPFEEIEVEVVPLTEPERTRNLIDTTSPVAELVDGGAPPVTISFGPEAELAPPAEARSSPEQEAPSTSDGRHRGWIFAFVFLGCSLALAAAILLWPPSDEPAGETSGSASTSKSATPDEIGSPPLPMPASADGESEGDGSEGGESADGESEGGESEGGEDSEGGGTEGGETDGDDPSAYVAGTDRPAPPGTFRAGPYITPLDPGGTTDQLGARQYCEDLAARAFVGESGWHLANPAELKKFIDSKQIKRGKYWTTALHKGMALAYTLPVGKKSSEKYERKLARPMCVAKY